MSIKLKILAWLLYNANTNPGFIYKKSFYNIKDQILKKYGELIGHDIQHIKKPCFACDSTGIFKCHWKLPETCWRCGGSGVYEEFFVLLSVYRLGKYEFHLPRERTYSPKYYWVDPENKAIRRRIYDYISHSATRWSTDCRLCLYFIYHPKLFFKILGSIGYSQKTPLSFMCNCFFELNPRRRIRRIKQWVRFYYWSFKNRNSRFDSDDIPF